MLGRVFTDRDDTPAAPRTVVLMYGTWQSRFGGRQDIVGQSLILDNAPYSVIGVLPREFHFAMRAAEFFTTIHDPSRCEQSRGCYDLYGLGRLRDGVSLEAAAAETKAIAARLEKEYPESNKGRSARLVPFRDAIVGDIRPTLLVLSSGAGLLLLIAYVNVASLLLVRAESRKRETVLRGVLGASVGRLIRQFVTEGVLLVAVARGPGYAGGFRGHSPAVQPDSRTPAARNAVFSRRRAAPACAAVRSRDFAAGGGGVLRDAGFAAVAFEPARGPCRRRPRLGGNIMETFRIEPGGGGAGDRDGAAGQRGTVGQEPVPHVPCRSELQSGEPGHSGDRRSWRRLRERTIRSGRFPSAWWSTSRPCRAWFPSPIPAICRSRATAIRRSSGCWGIRGTESTIRFCSGRPARITSRYCRPG